jgi:hypothetical protein
MEDVDISIGIMKFYKLFSIELVQSYLVKYYIIYTEVN